MSGLPEVKRRREELGLSQDQLGSRLEPPVTGKAVYYWETGRRSADTHVLRRLAAALGCAAGDLLAEPGLPLAAGGEA